jgi:hypothetical protein
VSVDVPVGRENPILVLGRLEYLSRTETSSSARVRIEGGREDVGGEERLFAIVPSVGPKARRNEKTQGTGGANCHEPRHGSRFPNRAWSQKRYPNERACDLSSHLSRGTGITKKS